MLAAKFYPSRFVEGPLTVSDQGSCPLHSNVLYVRIRIDHHCAAGGSLVYGALFWARSLIIGSLPDHSRVFCQKRLVGRQGSLAPFVESQLQHAIRKGAHALELLLSRRA